MLHVAAVGTFAFGYLLAGKLVNVHFVEAIVSRDGFSTVVRDITVGHTQYIGFMSRQDPFVGRQFIA